MRKRALFIASLPFLMAAPAAAQQNEAIVRVVDVGPGLCVVASIPGGHDLLYDGGHWTSSTCRAAVRDAVLGLYPTGYASKEDGVPLTSLAPSPAFAQVAAASRAHAETVQEGSELAGALDRALHAVCVEHRQALLDVRVVD